MAKLLHCDWIWFRFSLTWPISFPFTQQTNVTHGYSCIDLLIYLVYHVWPWNWFIKKKLSQHMTFHHDFFICNIFCEWYMWDWVSCYWIEYSLFVIRYLCYDEILAVNGLRNIHGIHFQGFRFGPANGEIRRPIITPLRKIRRSLNHDKLWLFTISNFPHWHFQQVSRYECNSMFKTI